jgi:glutaminyl-peptide cyclotransferase
VYSMRSLGINHLGMMLLVCSLALCGCTAQTRPPAFDADRAFTSLKKQCDFGPRPVGTPAHDRTRDFLSAELRKYTDSVELQSFKRVLAGRACELANIVARFGPADKQGILLCAHWDTRPTADQALEAADRKQPIIGANDGASGVAVLLELARMFHDNPPAVPVTIVLFDGEDYGQTLSQMFLGSAYFASHMEKSLGFKYGILLDMVGDKNLDIHREGNSQKKAGPATDKVWAAARSLGYDSYFADDVKYTISDDHIPLIGAGLPCADVIDFDYAYWHTLDDTIDKCSPKSLQIVGETIARVVYSEQL